MAKKPTFTIFYAWQSDTDPKHSRNLIETALKVARDRLNADPGVQGEVVITSDTKGVPGLCDIPAEILKRIAAADAAVLDLTFIAATNATPPKRCPNPNVLFELGYAFKAIGPERLICVMNDAHGGAAETMFDINHRRRPISYSSPREGFSPKQSALSLADRLMDALKPIIALGPRSAPDALQMSEERFSNETGEVRNYWDTTIDNPQGPTMFFSLRPAVYEKRRFKNADALEAALRQLQVIDLERQEFYPPMLNGTDVMPWGLFNKMYRWPDWSLAYSGQFWAAVILSAHYPYKLSERDESLHAYERMPDTLAPGQWIDYHYARLRIANAFRFAASWANAFQPEEQLVWSAQVEGISGSYCAASPGRFLLPCSRNCASPSASAGGTLSANEFKSQWLGCCLDIMEELFGMFDFCGERISRETLHKFLGNALAGRTE